MCFTTTEQDTGTMKDGKFYYSEATGGQSSETACCENRGEVCDALRTKTDHFSPSNRGRKLKPTTLTLTNTHTPSGFVVVL